jgi:hypothetical protein
MSCIFGSRGKHRLKRVMDAIGFEFPDYVDPVANIETIEKRKRFAKGTDKASKNASNADTNEDDNESENDEEPPSGSKKKKARTFVRKTSAAQEQGKGSTTTTLSLGCKRTLEVMTQPLPFSTLSPLGPILTWFVPTTKGVDKGGKSSVGKDILSEEEVESPHILGVGDSTFEDSSSSEEEDEKKTIEGGRSLGPEKAKGKKSQALP